MVAEIRNKVQTAGDKDNKPAINYVSALLETQACKFSFAIFLRG